MNHEEKLNAHICEYGLKGLLPQNLTDNILDRMLLEIDSYQQKNGETPASTLLIAILTLQNGKIIQSNTGSINIDFQGEDDLIDKFDSYIMCVTLESMRRETPLYIADDSLPTLKNIFDKKRQIQLSVLD